jgi:hypothetical protein
LVDSSPNPVVSPKDYFRHFLPHDFTPKLSLPHLKDSSARGRGWLIDRTAQSLNDQTMWPAMHMLSLFMGWFFSAPLVYETLALLR